MGFLGTRKPNVKALARREDIDGLVQAATFKDLPAGSDGETGDRGAVVREAAILALGALGPAAGNGTVAAALCDPSDRVRTAAVRVLHAREEAQLLAQALNCLPCAARKRSPTRHSCLSRPELARVRRRGGGRDCVRGGRGSAKRRRGRAAGEAGWVEPELGSNE
jgi:hypothetical protein